MKLLTFIITAIFVFLMLFSVHLYNELKEFQSKYYSTQSKLNRMEASYKDASIRIRELQEDNKALQRDFTAKIAKLTSRWSNTTLKLQKLAKRMNVAIDLYPELDYMIDAHIADNFDDQYSDLLQEEAAVENVEKFKRCLTAFKELNKQQRSLISIDIDSISSLYNESLNLMHRKVATDFNSKCSKIIEQANSGTKFTPSSLLPLKEEFYRLPESVKQHVKLALLERIDMLIEESKKV